VFEVYSPKLLEVDLRKSLRLLEFTKVVLEVFEVYKARLLELLSIVVLTLIPFIYKYELLIPPPTSKEYEGEVIPIPILPFEFIIRPNLSF
jgi:hypothetical protein